MRKIPIKTKEIVIDKGGESDYANWKFTARTNPPVRILSDITSGDLDRIISGLAGIIISWDFPDEDGNALPSPSVDSIGMLPMDLIGGLAEAYTKELSAVPPA